MSLEILTIPCLSDNYAFLAHDAATGDTALIDAPEAAPILAALANKGWRLTSVLLTHHHPDHVQALPEILAAHPASVVGARADAHRLPDLDVAVEAGDTVTIGGHSGTVIDVSGHTIGHVAFYFADAKAAFTADSLMALGCGRLFEGDADMMWASLSRLMELPADTVIYSGHEYTQANGAFALSIDPNNADLHARVADIAKARAAGQPTVPSLLSLELATNPFLRAHLPQVKEAVGMPDQPDALVFKEIRTRKDNF